jgi:hypothetical protein
MRRAGMWFVLPIACGGLARDETLLVPAEGTPRASADRAAGSASEMTGSRSEPLPMAPASTTPAGAPDPSPLGTTPANASDPSPASTTPVDEEQPTGLQDTESDASAGCQPGETRCNGAELQKCTADGTVFEAFQYCASAALCTVGGGSCASGCTPGEMHCSGSTLMRCNDDRTAYETVEQCSLGCGCIQAGCGCTQADAGDNGAR